MFLTGQDEISKAVAALQAGVAELPAGACMDLMILPIYAALPPELQVGPHPPVTHTLHSSCPRPSLMYGLLEHDELVGRGCRFGDYWSTCRAMKPISQNVPQHSRLQVVFGASRRLSGSHSALSNRGGCRDAGACGGEGMSLSDPR